MSLFETKFSILFAVCLVVFLILLPFNALLLFPRTLSHFHLINTFKPFLDAYLGPYKDDFSYWMGLQLLMRAVFLGLSALHRDVNLTIGAVLFGVMLCEEGLAHPFRSKFNNFQESLALLNLLAVCVIALHYDGNKEVEPLLLQCLILSMFAYVAVYIACHCVMSICGRTVKLRVSGVTKYFKNRIMSDSLSEMLHVKVSERKDTTEMMCSSYEEFQESLIALND